MACFCEILFRTAVFFISICCFGEVESIFDVSKQTSIVENLRSQCCFSESQHSSIGVESTNKHSEYSRSLWPREIAFLECPNEACVLIADRQPLANHEFNVSKEFKRSDAIGIVMLNASPTDLQNFDSPRIGLSSYWNLNIPFFSPSTVISTSAKINKVEPKHVVKRQYHERMDSYWHYYSDCDRWQVTFSNPYETKNVLRIEPPRMKKVSRIPLPGNELKEKVIESIRVNLKRGAFYLDPVVSEVQFWTVESTGIAPRIMGHSPGVYQRTKNLMASYVPYGWTVKWVQERWEDVEAGVNASPVRTAWNRVQRDFNEAYGAIVADKKKTTQIK